MRNRHLIEALCGESGAAVVASELKRISAWCWRPCQARKKSTERVQKHRSRLKVDPDSFVGEIVFRLSHAEMLKAAGRLDPNISDQPDAIIAAAQAFFDGAVAAKVKKCCRRCCHC